MDPRVMYRIIEADLEARERQEWIDLHRRPDALPLPPDWEEHPRRAAFSVAMRGAVDRARAWFQRPDASAVGREPGRPAGG